MVQVSIEPGDVDPFGYPENNSRTGSFNPTIPSLSAEVFADIVKQVITKATKRSWHVG